MQIEGAGVGEGVSGGLKVSHMCNSCRSFSIKLDVMTINVISVVFHIKREHF